MTRIGIFYGGKDNGGTAKVARRIQEILGKSIASLHNVHSATVDDVNK